MRFKTLNHLAIFILSLLVAGCDITEPGSFELEYVVEGYLYANEPLKEIRLSRTVPFGTSYLFEEQAVSSAQVQLNLLDQNGGVESSLAFSESDSAAGIYLPDDFSHLVRPLRNYELKISFPDDETIIQSTTLVPDTFRLVSVNFDSLRFDGTDTVKITVTPSDYPGRQTVYIFSTESLDPVVENLTPFFSDIFDADTDDIEELRISDSPLLNEANYEENPNGTLTIRLPWIAVTFFGPNIVSMNAVDNNIFDFESTLQIQQQGSTLSPGEIPNIVDNIDGATGVFGSYARISTSVFVARP